MIFFWEIHLPVVDLVVLPIWRGGLRVPAQHYNKENDHCIRTAWLAEARAGELSVTSFSMGTSCLSPLCRVALQVLTEIPCLFPYGISGRSHVPLFVPKGAESAVLSVAAIVVSPQNQGFQHVHCSVRRTELDQDSDEVDCMKHSFLSCQP